MEARWQRTQKTRWLSLQVAAQYGDDANPTELLKLDLSAVPTRHTSIDLSALDSILMASRQAGAKPVSRTNTKKVYLSADMQKEDKEAELAKSNKLLKKSGPPLINGKKPPSMFWWMALQSWPELW